MLHGDTMIELKNLTRSESQTNLKTVFTVPFSNGDDDDYAGTGTSLVCKT